MKKNIIFLFLLINLNTISQRIVTGEYYLRKTEMVAGFNFAPGGKFQFFYSYGAVDRNATGTFFIKGDTLKLKSDKIAGKDFTITSQTKNGNGYKLVFNHPNKYLVNHILCVFIAGDTRKEEYTNSTGELIVNLAHCDSISVLHGLYPDIPTLVKDKKNDNNTFQLSLNPSLEKISFKGIDFIIKDENTLTCHPNYFLPMDRIEFIKNR